MNVEYLSLNKALILEDSISWLSNYTLPSKDIEHIILNSNGEVDHESSKLLKELGEINERKEEILKILKHV